MEHVGRRVEVFWPEEEQWFPGRVAERGKPAGPRKPDEDLLQEQPGVGWRVEYDDGDEGWISHLRGNPYLRFVEDGSSMHLQSSSGLDDVHDSQSTALGASGQPHFLSSTFASALPEYANAETERILEAFQPQNFSSLSKLPAHLRPDAVLSTKQQTIRHNLTQDAKPKPTHRSLSRLGLFHHYEYIPSKYSIAEELARQDKLSNEIKMHTISSKTFVPASSEVKLKHEDLFLNKDIAYPYLRDPYEDSKHERAELLEAEKAKKLGGPFNPFGKADSEGTTKKLLPDIVKQIHKLLIEDWGSSNFSVMVDKDDLIVVRFEGSTVDSVRALKGYMNTIATDHSGLVHGAIWYNRYSLRRVLEAWGRQDEKGFVYYTFRPPWATYNPRHSAQILGAIQGGGETTNRERRRIP